MSDIVMRVRRGEAVFKPVSDKGRAWARENMSGSGGDVPEFGMSLGIADAFIADMKKSGLIVERASR